MSWCGSGTLGVYVCMWVGGGEGVHSRLCTTTCVFMPQVIVSAHAVSEGECCTGGRRWGLCGVCVCGMGGGGMRGFTRMFVYNFKFYNYIQYNFIDKCQYSCTGMFCGAKYTHHTFTPIIYMCVHDPMSL